MKKYQLLRFSLIQVISLSARGLFPFPAKITKQWDLRLMALSVSIPVYREAWQASPWACGVFPTSVDGFTALRSSSFLSSPLYLSVSTVSSSPLSWLHSSACFMLILRAPFPSNHSPSPTPYKAWLICGSHDSFWRITHKSGGGGGSFLDHPCEESCLFTLQVALSWLYYF